MKEFIKWYWPHIMLIIVWIALIVYVVVVCVRADSSTPVEKNDADSIIITHKHTTDSIKLEITKITHEKDERIKEVYLLDNDSSVKLFYELVSDN